MTVYCDHVFCQKPYHKRADIFYRKKVVRIHKFVYLARCNAHELFGNSKIFTEISEKEYLASKVLES